MDPFDIPLITASRADGVGTGRRTLAREALRGNRHRLAAGVYVETEEWEALDPRQRRVLDLRAVAETSAVPPVFSHWSAAALLGLPSGVRPETRAHRSLDSGSSPNRAGVVTHVMPVPVKDITEVRGLRATGLARTAVDIAASAAFDDAVIVADAALRLLAAGDNRGRALLAEAWQRAQPRKAGRKVAGVIEFATGLSESPNESVSRVTMHRIGLPAPILQQRFRDARGFVGRTDFWFPQFRAVGEADGKVKYLDPTLTKAQAAQVLYEEKLREDRLRALGLIVIRWGWREAISPRELSAVFAAYGIRL